MVRSNYRERTVSYPFYVMIYLKQVIRQVLYKIIILHLRDKPSKKYCFFIEKIEKWSTAS